MPVCPQCDNRQFTNKEALLQHMRSSSAWHPFCIQCDRRFVSETAYDAHVAAKHPPTFDCTVCERTFHAPFALEDHYRGSNAHPNCTKCGKGFRDLAACDEHRRTEHPKSSCVACGGRIIYDDELPAHFWDSPNHPKCNPCKLGLKDDATYVEHMSSVHPEQHCALCNANFDTPEALQAHYWASPAHPKCDLCNVGLLNNEARDLHLETVHTPTPTVTATTTVVAEQVQEDIATKETAAVNDGVPAQASSLEVGSVTATEPNSTSAAADTTFRMIALPFLPPSLQKTEPLMSTSSSMYHTGFTPLSPRNPIQRLIIGEHRQNTPELRMELGFSSPILDATPPFSPSVLPRPGNGEEVEKIWNSKKNIQISESGITQFTATSYTDSYNTKRLSFYGQPNTTAVASPSTSSSSTWFDNSPVLRTQESLVVSSQRQPSSLVSSPPRLIASPPRYVSPPRERLSSPPRTEFNPRLYPGSARANLRQTLGTLTETVLGNDSINGSRGYRSAASVSGGTSYSSTQPRTSQSPPHAYSHSSYASSITGRSRGLHSDVVNWEDLMGPAAPGSPESVFSNPRGNSRATLFSETLNTPKTQVPSPTWSSVGNASPHQLYSEPSGPLGQARLGQNLAGQQNAATTSPSLVTASSPASGSSALGNSPGSSAQCEADTRPTTASSSTPSHTTPVGSLVYTITPTSKCASPEPSPVRSPDSGNLSFTLRSPVGIPSLPLMSPLPSTPLDITYDIPEARQPLPESPTEGTSPLTTIVELPNGSNEEEEDATPNSNEVEKESRELMHVPLELDVPLQSTSPSSTSSAQSFITSPQEPDEAEAPRTIPTPIALPSLPASPKAYLTAVDLALDIDTVGASSFLTDELEMSTSTPVDNTVDQSYTLASTVSSPLTPVAYGGPEADSEEGMKGGMKAVDSGADATATRNPLHCRVCLADSCDDITASMCGHIFCNRCITDAVIKTSRCPVCMTPTLLYCLFRLDLAA
ncbi:hypothetical protein BDN70DRAFT_920190 [Pholiota conissans]|uniref:RING-type domain-containing protein n=1 Tax=Pholiota conissans TaxID=109636 RepID=A0A9P5Z4Z9_9AGAR|nr:hypothetical protein BDN70DRAFT_920190 [Pholiota conissans]